MYHAQIFEFLIFRGPFWIFQGWVKYYNKKKLFWSFDFKISEEVPNRANNNKTKKCIEEITF